MKNFTKNEIIKGLGFFDDQIDGQAVKSGSVFIEEELDDSKGTAKGFRTVDYPVTDPEIIKRCIHLDFPINAEVEYQVVVSRRAHKFSVCNIKPIARVGGQPHPEAKKAA